MKKILCSAIIILSFMLLVPLGVIKQTESTAATANAFILKSSGTQKGFRVLNTETGEVANMDTEEYIFGVVAAEMPALYETEALKAQATAAYTYACRKRSENADKTYDITDDPTTDQSFISKEDAVKRWGDNADEYCKKIEAAVKEGCKYTVTYDGNPALTVYHAISSGKTESCEDIWGKKLPYLCSVSSPGDRLSPDYIKTTEISTEKFKASLEAELELTGEPENYIGSIVRTDAGSVKTVEICKNSVSGSRIRSIFDLRSSNFEIKYSEGKFVFTVYGYGHGVGMSQYGANYMAKQGSGFKEILTAYYTGCKIEKTG